VTRALVHASGIDDLNLAAAALAHMTRMGVTVGDIALLGTALWVSWLRVMLSGSRRRHSGALPSGRPRRCRKYQHVRDDNRPCSNYGSVGRPHRGSKHLNRPEYGWTCAEVRGYEDDRCRPSQTIDGANAHRDQATASVGPTSLSVIVTRSILAFSHS
jgi:hypothetical protein